MPRQARYAPGGIIYHVMNRAVARLTLFEKEHDYIAFEKVLRQAYARVPLRILSYCVMPNHWHFVVWPRTDGELTDFFRWLTHTHTMRWHLHHQTVGTGHLYQGRFKSFPAQDDGHLFTVLRYVERNPLRANLVRRAEQWRWSSLWQRIHHSGTDLLHEWPQPYRGDWVAFVNRAETRREIDALRRCVVKGRPFGDDGWAAKIADRLHLAASFRERGRPKGTAGK